MLSEIENYHLVQAILAWATSLVHQHLQWRGEDFCADCQDNPGAGVHVCSLQVQNVNKLLLVQYFSESLNMLMNRCAYRQRQAEGEVASQLRRRGVPADEASYIANSYIIRQKLRDPAVGVEIFERLWSRLRIFWRHLHLLLRIGLTTSMYHRSIHLRTLTNCWSRMPMNLHKYTVIWPSMWMTLMWMHWTDNVFAK